MKHFGYMDKETLDNIFYKLPNEVTKDTPKDVLACALGGTLYTPATRENIDEFLISRKYPELSSLVICLEDAIGDDEVEQAEDNLYAVLKRLKDKIDDGDVNLHDLPLLFIRIREPRHLQTLMLKIHTFKSLITGFVFPKFDEHNGDLYFHFLEKVNKQYDMNYYCMPILESERIIYQETRLKTLKAIHSIFKIYKHRIINIRIGATDFSSCFGLRRSRDFTVYDIHVIRSCITDIFNYFSRSSDGFVISGPVWEYFDNHESVLKPQLRASLFTDYLGDVGALIRNSMIKKNLDGFVREILLDRENGLIGKTIIHPSHVSIVNALYVVSREEYLDALSILEKENIGVKKSEYNNKMNEVKPHTNWAKKIMRRAEVFGVFNDGCDFVSLLTYRMDGLN